MPVPKYRTSASKRNMRRSHHALKAPGLSICPNCQEVKPPHVACKACGYYNNIEILTLKNSKPDTNNLNLDTSAANKSTKTESTKTTETQTESVKKD